MQTLYIDVYFLINFSVDMISVYFAAVISMVPSTQRRLLLGALIGSLMAIVKVFLPSYWFIEVILFAVYILILIIFVTNGVSTYRKFKFIASFLVVEFLLGGFIQFFYGILDKYVLKYLSDTQGGGGNSRLIVIALIILLSIAVLRLTSSLFSSRLKGGEIEVEISFRGKSVLFDAFCDSGNLAKDPLDLSPVVMVKRSAIAPLFQKGEIDAVFSGEDRLLSGSYELKKKMRLIPVKGSCGDGMMLGIKPDSINICQKKTGKKTKIRATVAIDNEGGSYGGYQGLVPTAAISDALV